MINWGAGIYCDPEDFDQQDPKNMGRPLYFDVQGYVSAVESMIRSDDIQFALTMIDNVPAYYRDNPIQQLVNIKNKIYQQCYDQYDYASDFDEANWKYDDIIAQCFTNYTYPRADLLGAHVKELNAKSEEPWICELSPSHGWLPLGFAHHGLKFNFFGKNLNQPALAKIKSHLSKEIWADRPKPNQPKILVCFESIEHMWRPEDVENAAKKIGVTFDYIYLSVPYATLGGGLPDWSTRRIGHVRTWSKQEFLTFANKTFAGYAWELYESHSMVLRGKFNGSI